MMKNLYFLIIGLLLICLNIHEAKATHVLGADISYKCLGDEKYEFTIVVYRDCGGELIEEYSELDYKSVSCNVQGKISLKRERFFDISPVCTAVQSECKVSGGYPGIEQHVFKGTFTLPSKCTDWVFSWTSCNRSGDITNIIKPLQECLYIEAKLNNLDAPCNNAPSFANPPVAFLCKGQTSFLNPGTIEEDGDKLTFSVTTPKTGGRTDAVVAFVPPFSASNPLTSFKPFSVNSTNGDIQFSPANDKENTVTAILVEERRNGKVIGSVMRDMSFYTKNCENSNPVLSGINNTLSDSIAVCAGQQICFNIFGSDPENQNLKMTWNQPWDTSVAQFKVTGGKKNPKANLCWKTKASDAGLHLFTVTLSDDFCPITGITTRAYKIRVQPPPLVDLPKDTVIPCNRDIVLTPVITPALGNYVYKWNTGELTRSVTKREGHYKVTVTDALGCKGDDTINVSTGVKADFKHDSVCTGMATHFWDQSISKAGTIVSYDWDFGDPASGAANKSTLEDPEHIFSVPGYYQVRLEVTDNFGCKGAVTKKVRYCDIPKVNFKALDSCQLNPVIVQDLTTISRCLIIRYVFQIGNTVQVYDYTKPEYKPINPNGGWNFLANSPGDTGKQIISLTAINENGCSATKSGTITIFQKPVAKIQESSYLYRCNRPDTILHGEAFDGKPPYTFIWSNGSTKDTAHIHGPGKYTFTVTDANGCSHTDEISISDPLIPRLGGKAFCEPTMPVQYIDSSYSAWDIAQWKYVFDDGTTFTTSDPAQKDASHLYTLGNRIYEAKLILTDVTGCMDTASKKIVHKFPDNNFKIDPTPLCLGQELNLQSPSGVYIDSLYWNFGNGDTLALTRDDLKYTVNGEDTLYSYKDTYGYATGAGNTYNVSLKMYYHKKQCIRNYTQPVSLFPELKVSVDSIRGQCGDFPTHFYASQKSDASGSNKVTSWDWKFEHREHEPPFTLEEVGTSADQNPVMTFDEHGNYFYTLRATNGNGCMVAFNQQVFNIIKLPTPEICLEDSCQLQKTYLFAFCNKWPEVRIDSFYWDFGDGKRSNIREPFHIYANSGPVTIKAKVYNTSYGCASDTSSKKVYIYPLPESDFNGGSFCLGDSTPFIDLSKPAPSDEISSWEWDFGDGEKSFDRNPVHQYRQVGTYEVTLVTRSKVSGCRDTFPNMVTVNPVPEAGFTVTANELVPERPIVFIDQSSQDVVRWHWNYGDGTTEENLNINKRNAEHTYTSSVKAVEVEQIVYNQEGCSDTARLKIDLDVYYKVPNSFTPNSDGNNDRFYPSYKGIEQIFEYRVYDRWGQLIYDGGEGNMAPAWDGTYKGTAQPVGVYVYYTRAIGYNKKEYVLSGNVTLIR